jgi:oxalate decarboxylase/phosphoglucose isomerase-like protein (cupin superfamily)
MYIENCRLIEFPKITDARGNLTFVEAERHVPFKIERIFYLYDVPHGQTRGGHAHKRLEQVLICLSGSFDVLIEDGHNQKHIELKCPAQGLYIPPLIWDTEMNFSPGSVCLVVASAAYCENDYHRNYGDYLEAVLAARSLAR